MAHCYKKIIQEASEFAGERLLTPSALSRRTLPELLGSASDISGWGARIEGELRSRLVLGKPSLKRVQEVLQTIVGSDDLRDMLKGFDGYRWVADTLCEGRMDKGYKLMSATCKFTGRDFRSLTWPPQFAGTVEQHRTIESFVLDRANVPRIEALLQRPRAERLELLKGIFGEAEVRPSIQDLSRQTILAAVPEWISDRIGRRDFFIEGESEDGA